jgi:hypothetical protein
MSWYTVLDADGRPVRRLFALDPDTLDANLKLNETAQPEPPLAPPAPFQN